MEPLVSVVVPTYNADKYLKESVDSILNQTYSNMEILFIDDNSTDNTILILQEYANSDTRVRIIHGPCKGIGEALNCGIDLSNGKYIARADADDILFNDRFEKQVKYMEQNEDVGICSARINPFREDGIFAYVDDYPLNDEEIRARLLFNTSVRHPTVMFRSSVIKNRWRYAPILPEDYDLWTRMAVSEKFVCLPDVLVKYRIHEGSGTRTTNRGEVEAAASKSAMKYAQTMLGIDVAQYKPEDFYVLYDGCEPVESYIFRQYLLLNELCKKNKERNVFSENVLYVYINERWKAVCDNCGLKIMDNEQCLNFDVLRKQSDDVVRNKLKNTIENIRKLFRTSKKVIIYGTGIYGIKILKTWNNAKNQGKMDWKLVCLVDKIKTSALVGEKTYEVMKPEVLPEMEFDFVIVSPLKGLAEIKERLLELGVSENKILYGNVFRLAF